MKYSTELGIWCVWESKNVENFFRKKLEKSLLLVKPLGNVLRRYTASSKI